MSGRAPGGNGIVGFSPSQLTQNTLQGNGDGDDTQLFVGAGVGYALNSIEASGTNATVSGGNDLGQNVCNSLPSCP